MIGYGIQAQNLILLRQSMIHVLQVGEYLLTMSCMHCVATNLYGQRMSMVRWVFGSVEQALTHPMFLKCFFLLPAIITPITTMLAIEAHAASIGRPYRTTTMPTTSTSIAATPV